MNGGLARLIPHGLGPSLPILVQGIVMRIALLGGLLLLLGACGGGNGGSGDPPPVANRAPSFTSAAAVSVPENSAGTVYQAAATDPDGDSLTFSISGGADAGRFTLGAAGALAFATPPNFEAPADANADNVYLVQIRVSDGALDARLDLAVTVTNLPDVAGLRTIGGFTRPTSIAAIPGSSQIFVAEEGGNVYRTDPAAPGPGTLYLTIGDLRVANEQGVLSIAAAPDYATSGLLYAYVVSGAGNIEVRRYGRLPAGGGDTASADVILSIPTAPLTANAFSYGGGLAFGPDGFLYIGTGEGRNTAPARPIDPIPPTNAQNPASLLGKILRLDVSRDAFPGDPNRDYGIPAGNPFAGGGGAPEVFAYGLSDPRQISFDGANLLIGDGQREPISPEPASQELFLLRPQDAGAYFGYGPSPEPAATLPVIRYGGTTIGGRGDIVSGHVYRGPITEFTGLYIFADRVLGQDYSVPASSLVQGTILGQAAFTARTAVLSPDAFSVADNFGVDADGNLFIIDIQTGNIYMLTLV